MIEELRLAVRRWLLAPRKPHLEMLKSVREETGCSLHAVREAWDATDGDRTRMIEYLRRRGQA
jgi:translation elongation factor EF-Ts